MNLKKFVYFVTTFIVLLGGTGVGKVSQLLRVPVRGKYIGEDESNRVHEDKRNWEEDRKGGPLLKRLQVRYKIRNIEHRGSFHGVHTIRTSKFKSNFYAFLSGQGTILLRSSDKITQG